MAGGGMMGGMGGGGNMGASIGIAATQVGIGFTDAMFQIRAGIAERKALRRAAKQVKRQAEAVTRFGSLEVTRQTGRLRAGFASAGVDVSSGSPLDVLAQEAFFGEMKVALDAYPFRAQARQLQQAGRAALETAILGATRTLLGSLFEAIGGSITQPTRDPTVQGGPRQAQFEGSEPHPGVAAKGGLGPTGGAPVF